MSGDRQIRFLGTISPLMERRELAVALRHLSEDWSVAELTGFLSSDLDSVVELAARCLGYVGNADQARELSAVLSHRQASVASVAEDALWSIWMRAGGDPARQLLASAITFAGHDEPEAALALLGDLCRSLPNFAEAHHQRGIVLFSIEAYDAAREAFAAALALNPVHFSAAASLGHIAVESGRLAEALHHYHTALHIHPHLREIAEIVPDLEIAVKRRIVA